MKIYLSHMNNQIAVAEKLLQIKAIKLSPDDPFTWASGIKSPIYCDNRKVLGFPYIRDFIKSEMCNVIFENFPDTDLLAGVATAGIAWGAMAADQLKLPYIYVRPKPKEHGLGNQIEGFYEPNKKVVIIEDLISTGMSSVEVVKVLKNSGLVISGMVSIFTYGFKEAEDTFKNEEVQVISLTSYDILLQAAIKMGYISAEMENTLLKWKANPAQWLANN